MPDNPTDKGEGLLDRLRGWRFLPFVVCIVALGATVLFGFMVLWYFEAIVPALQKSVETIPGNYLTVGYVLTVLLCLSAIFAASVVSRRIYLVNRTATFFLRLLLMLLRIAILLVPIAMAVVIPEKANSWLMAVSMLGSLFLGICIIVFSPADNIVAGDTIPRYIYI
jgi:hypothetical protein